MPKLLVRRKAFTRDPHARRTVKGRVVRVKRTHIPSTSFKIKDRGKPGRDLSPAQRVKLRQAFHEVKGEKIPRKQQIAIALSKARARGIPIPRR